MGLMEQNKYDLIIAENIFLQLFHYSLYLFVAQAHWSHGSRPITGFPFRLRNDGCRVGVKLYSLIVYSPDFGLYVLV